MKPSCWTPLPRLCCETGRRQEPHGGTLAGPVARRAARGTATRLDRPVSGPAGAGAMAGWLQHTETPAGQSADRRARGGTRQAPGVDRLATGYGRDLAFSPHRSAGWVPRRVAAVRPERGQRGLGLKRRCGRAWDGAFSGWCGPLRRRGGRVLRGRRLGSLGYCRVGVRSLRPLRRVPLCRRLQARSLFINENGRRAHRISGSLQAGKHRG